MSHAEDYHQCSLCVQEDLQCAFSGSGFYLQLAEQQNVCKCMQACPHDSVELRLRPPGIDLWTSHKPMAAEVALQFTLLGAGMLPR